MPLASKSCTRASRRIRTGTTLLPAGGGTASTGPMDTTANWWTSAPPNSRSSHCAPTTTRTLTRSESDSRLYIIHGDVTPVNLHSNHIWYPPPVLYRCDDDTVMRRPRDWRGGFVKYAGAGWYCSYAIGGGRGGPCSDVINDSSHLIHST